MSGLVAGCGHAGVGGAAGQSAAAPTSPPTPTPTPTPTPVLTNPQPVPFGSLVDATAVVTSNQVGSVGQDFLGLSIEKARLSLSAFSTSDADLVNRFKDLGPRVLRVGGNSVDTNTWVPNGTRGTAGNISRLDVDAFAAFVKATGWKVMYGINLAQNTPAAAADEALYAYNALGSSFSCFEIGNEPDLFNNTYIAPDGTKTWTYATFKSKWDSLHDAILQKVSGAMFSGPGAANNVAKYAVAFATSMTTTQLQSFKSLSQHHYRIHASDPQTIDFLLVAPDPVLAVGSSTEPARLPTLKAAADKINVPFRITETNSAINGGIAGVSDVYASTLWSLDLMFTIAKGGAEGLNFHTGSTSNYTPLAFNNTSLIEIRPEFYGILFFHMAGQGKVLDATISAGSNNVSVYSIQTVSGYSVVFVNKESSNFNVALQLPSSVSRITSTYLTGPGLTSKTGINIQNATISVTNGLGAMDPKYDVLSAGQNANVYVPALTAVLVEAY